MQNYSEPEIIVVMWGWVIFLPALASFLCLAFSGSCLTYHTYNYFGCWTSWEKLPLDRYWYIWLLYYVNRSTTQVLLSCSTRCLNEPGVFWSGHDGHRVCHRRAVRGLRHLFLPALVINSQLKYRNPLTMPPFTLTMFDTYVARRHHYLSSLPIRKIHTGIL